MLSGLDLLKGTSTQPAKTGLDLLQGTAPVKGDAQVKTGLDLLDQQVVTEAPTTEVPIAPDVHPATTYLEKFTKPSIEEYDKYQMAPLITAENVAPAMDTLGRLWNLAQHPYDVVKGAAVFASEIPGFIGGLASAIGQVPIEILKGGTVLDWYNASARNMQTISGMWHKGVSAPLGKLLETPERMGEELAQTMFGAEPEVRKDEAELVGEIFMVPYTASSAPLHAMADSPTWNDHPNVRGLLKFTADALGLVTMGLVLKGGPVMASRRAEPIVKRAHDIDTREKAIEASGLDEIIKTAQKKVLDIEKVQLELEIESLKKELDHEKLAKENLKEKGKKVKKAKEGVDIETEAIRDERLKFAEERVKEIPEEKPKTGIKLIKKIPPKPPKLKKVKRPKPIATYLRTETVNGKEINMYKIKGGPFDGKEVTESYLKMLNIKKPKIKEPITNLDLQTGTKEPPSLSTESSPFRETPERTQMMKEVYAERAKAVESDPELLTNKLLNDINRWLDGEDLPVEEARNNLSEMAARAEELERGFVSKTNFLRWKDTVSDAATWARKADRAKIERTIEIPEERQIYEIAPEDITKYENTDLFLSSELEQLHNHKARTLGFKKVGGSLVEGYLKLLAKAAEKVDMDLAIVAHDALSKYKKGDLTQAALDAENVIGKIHAKEVESITPNKITETHKSNIQKALESGKLAPEEYTRLHEKSYGPLEEFKKDRLKIKRPEGPTLYTGLPVDKIIKLSKPFKKWFGKSKIKEITYHGTSAEFLEFDPTKKYGGIGFHFGTEKQAASRMKEIVSQAIEFGEEAKPTILEGYLKIERPLYMDDALGWDVEAFANAMHEQKLPLGKEAIRKIDKLNREYQSGKLHVYEANKELEQILKDADYDGIIYENKVEGIGTSYAIFDPSQFKSIENVGTYGIDTGQFLYSGLPLDEAVKQLKSMAKHTAEFMKEFKGSFKEKEFDFGHVVKQVKADTIRSLWDQSETLLNIVKDKYPEEYNRVVTRQRSAVTGIGYGKVLYGQAVKEIYGGKSKEMIEATNAYIFARRFKDIYGYRPEKGYKHQPGYGATQTINTTAMIEMIKDIPPETWRELSAKVPEMEALFGKLTSEEMVDVVKGGEAYFEWSRRIVDDIVAAGIKTPEEGVLLKAHDFRKFKTMLIKKLYDFNYDLQLKGETIKVNNSGVLELGAGNTKIIEPDSRVVLSEQMARAYGSIAHQAAMLEWKGLADRHSDNGFVSVKKQSGWSPIPYMADGVRKNLYFHPDSVKYLVTRSRDLSPRLSMVIRGLTMAPVTRALAVGLSPIWSTLAGLPMDVMHSLWAARTWEADAKGVRPKATFPFYEVKEGKFKKIYSPFAGVDALQIGLDMKRTLGDVYGRGPLTENLMKHGLVMNFLTQRQNRYMKGVKPPGDWAKMMDLMSYHGLSMELWARVATADRVIRRRTKELGITYEKALKSDDIMYEAAHAGRDRMDYNQGGWLVKALDQSGMIFLNAAVLGTRTFWRQAVDNPVDFAFRTAQLGLTAAGITAAAWSLYPETMKDMSTQGSKRDVTWPIAPNWLKVKDIDGEDISFYFKLRMDPNAAFMYRIFEGLTKTYMYDQGLIKEEPDYRELVDSLKQLGPVDVKLPPATQAWIDYVTNYSWWKDRQMYTQMGGKTLDWPKSQHEGEFDSRVPQMAKDIGGVTKLSPTRLAGTVSNVIPRNNEFVWLMGSAYEEAFSDVPEEVRKQHWLVTLAETPGFNKVIGITRHGRGRWKVKSDIENEVELERMVRNSKFDMLATQNAWYGVKNKEKLSKFMKEQEFDVHKNMVDVFKFIKDPVVKTLPHRDFWLSMRHMSIEGRAKTWVELLDRSSETEKKQLINELNQVMIVGGVVTPKFMEEVGKLKTP